MILSCLAIAHAWILSGGRCSAYTVQFHRICLASWRLERAYYYTVELKRLAFESKATQGLARTVSGRACRTTTCTVPVNNGNIDWRYISGYVVCY